MAVSVVFIQFNDDFFLSWFSNAIATHYGGGEREGVVVVV